MLIQFVVVDVVNTFDSDKLSPCICICLLLRCFSLINVLTQYFDTHVYTDIAYVEPYLYPLEVVPTIDIMDANSSLLDACQESSDYCATF